MQVQPFLSKEIAQNVVINVLKRPILKKNRKAVELLCVESSVKNLWIFGSFTTSSFNRKSDIDFLVEFKPLDFGDYADAYFNFLFGLQAIFKQEIDLLTIKSLKNPYFIKSVSTQKQLIYGIG
jgi:uncharacterized protein